MTKTENLSSEKTIPNVPAEGKKKANVPNLRFPQYTSNWVKKRLLQLVNMSKGYGITKDQLTDEGNPCILYGELYTTYKNEIISFVKSKTNIPPKNLVYSKANDVIIPSSGETPEDIATACCVTLDDIILGGDLNVLRPINHNGCFLSYQLNGCRKYDIAKIAQGASIVHLHNEHLAKIEIFTPEQLEEEQKIVALLTKIDERIETQSKIIEEYKSLKNLISNQLIFHNSRLDNLIQLGDLASLKNGFAFKSDSYTEDGEYNIITIANVQGDRYINAKSCNKIQQLPNDIQSHQILKNDDILISLTGNVGRVSLVNLSNCLLNQRVGVLKCKKNSIKKYLYQVLSSKNFENNMILKGQGAAQKNIGNNDVESFMIPFSEDELYLNKIVCLLESFDKKIAIEEHILNGYMSQKKYFLTNMFI